jgi:hypothetical protein
MIEVFVWTLDEEGMALGAGKYSEGRLGFGFLVLEHWTADE